MRHSTRSNTRSGLVVCLLVLAVFTGGCSSQTAVPAASAKSPSPKHPAPDYSLARPAAAAALGGVESRNLSGAPTPFRLGSLVASESPVSVTAPIDASRPLLEQIPPTESVDWPVLAANGRLVAEITIEWNGSAWSHVSDNSVADSPYRRGLTVRKGRASDSIVKALGGAPEATRAVRSKYGLWQLARRGSRETGVLVSSPPLETAKTAPFEGVAYSGPDLFGWLEAQ